MTKRTLRRCNQFIGSILSAALVATSAIQPLAAAQADFHVSHPRSPFSPAASPLRRLTADSSAAGFTNDASLAPIRRAAAAASRTARLHASRWLPSGKTVFVFQDVHMQPEAQRNIGQALEAAMAAAPGLKWVIGAEAADGKIDYSTFRRFPDKTALTAAADDLLASNQISAVSWLGLTTARHPSFVGVDDRALYRQNVAVYRDAAAHQAEALRAIDWERASLARRRPQMSAPARRLWSDLEAFYRGSETISDLLAAYPSIAARHDQLRTFAGAVAAEGRIDLKAAERERGALVDVLSRRPTALEEVGRLAVAFQTGGLGVAAFYEALLKTAERERVSLDAYPHFRAYADYVGKADALDLERLFAETNVFIDDAIASVASPADRPVLQRAVYLQLAERLVRFELSPDDLRFYRSLHQKAPADLARFEAFYSAAEHRNDSLVSKLEAAMSASGAEAGALVVGGFHTEGVLQRLAAHGFSCVVFSPKFTAAGTQGSDYLSVFLQERAPLAKVFAGQRVTLAAANRILGATDPIEPPVALGPLALRLGEAASKDGVADRDERAALSGTADLAVTGEGSGTLSTRQAVVRFSDRPLANADGAVKAGDTVISYRIERPSRALPRWAALAASLFLIADIAIKVLSPAAAGVAALAPAMSFGVPLAVITPDAALGLVGMLAPGSLSAWAMLGLLSIVVAAMVPVDGDDVVDGEVNVADLWARLEAGEDGRDIIDLLNLPDIQKALWREMMLPAEAHDLALQLTQMRPRIAVRLILNTYAQPTKLHRVLRIMRRDYPTAEAAIMARIPDGRPTEAIKNARPLVIAYAASEHEDYFSTGGVGDVAKALPETLHELGHYTDLFSMLPPTLYDTANQRKMGVEAVTDHEGHAVVLNVPVGATFERMSLYRVNRDKGHPIYFVDSPRLREAMGTDGKQNLNPYLPSTQIEDPYVARQKVVERFVLMDLGILHAMPVLHRLGLMDAPDVVHANDWHTGVLSAWVRYLQDTSVELFLKDRHENAQMGGGNVSLGLRPEQFLELKQFYEKTGIVFTNHNSAMQGLFPLDMVRSDPRRVERLSREIFDMTGLPTDPYFVPMSMVGGEYHGQFNSLLIGAQTSDITNAVSAEEAVAMGDEAQSGFGLASFWTLLRAIRRLVGELNGIGASWNPTRALPEVVYQERVGDHHVERRIQPVAYTSRTIETDKPKNKEAFQKAFGLKVDGDAPLLFFIGRLTEQKGPDIVAAVAERIAEDPSAQFVVLGSGEIDEHVERLLALAEAHSDRIHVILDFNRDLARALYRVGDGLVMPSKWEPGGSNQLIAMAMGTPVIATPVGGLKESVLDYDANGPTIATGFLAATVDAGAVVDKVDHFLALYRSRRNGDYWAVARNGMRRDSSWELVASRYVDNIYDVAIQHRNARSGIGAPIVAPTLGAALELELKNRRLGQQGSLAQSTLSFRLGYLLVAGLAWFVGRRISRERYAVSVAPWVEVFVIAGLSLLAYGLIGTHLFGDWESSIQALNWAAGPQVPKGLNPLIASAPAGLALFYALHFLEDLISEILGLIKEAATGPPGAAGRRLSAWKATLTTRAGFAALMSENVLWRGRNTLFLLPWFLIGVAVNFTIASLFGVTFTPTIAFVVLSGAALFTAPTHRERNEISVEAGLPTLSLGVSPQTPAADQRAIIDGKLSPAFVALMNAYDEEGARYDQKPHETETPADAINSGRLSIVIGDQGDAPARILPVIEYLEDLDRADIEGRPLTLEEKFEQFRLSMPPIKRSTNYTFEEFYNVVRRHADPNDGKVGDVSRPAETVKPLSADTPVFDPSKTTAAKARDNMKLFQRMQAHRAVHIFRNILGLGERWFDYDQRISPNRTKAITNGFSVMGWVVSALVLSILGAIHYMGGDRVVTWVQASDINRRSAELALRHPLMSTVPSDAVRLTQLNGLPNLNPNGGVRRDPNTGQLVRTPAGALAPILEALEGEDLIRETLNAWNDGLELVVFIPNGDDVGAQPDPNAIAGLLDSDADIMFFLADRKLTYEATLNLDGEAIPVEIEIIGDKQLSIRRKDGAALPSWLIPPAGTPVFKSENDQNGSAPASWNRSALGWTDAADDAAIAGLNRLPRLRIDNGHKVSLVVNNLTIETGGTPLLNDKGEARMLDTAEIERLPISKFRQVEIQVGSTGYNTNAMIGSFVRMLARVGLAPADPRADREATRRALEAALAMTPAQRRDLIYRNGIAKLPIAFDKGRAVQKASDALYIWRGTFGFMDRMGTKNLREQSRMPVLAYLALKTSDQLHKADHRRGMVNALSVLFWKLLSFGVGLKSDDNREVDPDYINLFVEELPRHWTASEVEKPTRLAHILIDGLQGEDDRWAETPLVGKDRRARHEPPAEARITLTREEVLTLAARYLSQYPDDGVSTIVTGFLRDGRVTSDREVEAIDAFFLLLAKDLYKAGWMIVTEGHGLKGDQSRVTFYIAPVPRARAKADPSRVETNVDALIWPQVDSMLRNRFGVAAQQLGFYEDGHFTDSFRRALYRYSENGVRYTAEDIAAMESGRMHIVLGDELVGGKPRIVPLLDFLNERWLRHEPAPVVVEHMARFMPPFRQPNAQYTFERFYDVVDGLVAGTLRNPPVDPQPLPHDAAARARVLVDVRSITGHALARANRQLNDMLRHGAIRFVRVMAGQGSRYVEKDARLGATADEVTKGLIDVFRLRTMEERMETGLITLVNPVVYAINQLKQNIRDRLGDEPESAAVVQLVASDKNERNVIQTTDLHAEMNTSDARTVRTDLMVLRGVPNVGPRGVVRNDGVLMTTPAGAISPLFESIADRSLLRAVRAAYQRGLKPVMVIPNGEDTGAVPDPRAMSAFIDSDKAVMFGLVDRAVTYWIEGVHNGVPFKARVQAVGRSRSVVLDPLPAGVTLKTADGQADGPMDFTSEEKLAHETGVPVENVKLWSRDGKKPGKKDDPGTGWKGAPEDAVRKLDRAPHLVAEDGRPLNYHVQMIEWEKGGTPMINGIDGNLLILDDFELVGVKSPFEVDALKFDSMAYNSNIHFINVEKALKEMGLWDDNDADPLGKWLSMAPDEYRQQLNAILDPILRTKLPVTQDGDRLVNKASDMLRFLSGIGAIFDRYGVENDMAYLALKSPPDIHDAVRLETMKRQSGNDMLDTPSHFAPIDGLKAFYVSLALFEGRDPWPQAHWEAAAQKEDNPLPEPSATHAVTVRRGDLLVAVGLMAQQLIDQYPNTKGADLLRRYIDSSSNIRSDFEWQALQLGILRMWEDIYDHGWMVVTEGRGIYVNGESVTFYVAPVMRGARAEIGTNVNHVTATDLAATLDAEYAAAMHDVSPGDFRATSKVGDWLKGAVGAAVAGVLLALFSDYHAVATGILFGAAVFVFVAFDAWRAGGWGTIATQDFKAGGEWGQIQAGYEGMTVLSRLLNRIHERLHAAFGSSSDLLVHGTMLAALVAIGTLFAFAPSVGASLHTTTVLALGLLAVSPARRAARAAIGALSDAQRARRYDRWVAARHAARLKEGLSRALPDMETLGLSRLTDRLIGAATRPVHPIDEAGPSATGRRIVADAVSDALVQHGIDVALALDEARNPDQVASLVQSFVGPLAYRLAIEGADADAFAALLAGLAEGYGASGDRTPAHFRALLLAAARRYAADVEPETAPSAPSAAHAAYYSYEDLADAAGAAAGPRRDAIRPEILQLADELFTAREHNELDAANGARYVFVAAPAGVSPNDVRAQLRRLFAAYGVTEVRGRPVEDVLRLSLEIDRTDKANPYALADKLRRARGLAVTTVAAHAMSRAHWALADIAAYERLDPAAARSVMVDFLDLETGVSVSLTTRIQAAIESRLSA